MPVQSTVLIVDDNSMIRSLLRSCFQNSADWNVCGEAENGKMAVEKVEELHPDIVLLDFEMPVMNGLEAARQIARMAPKTALIMFTLHASTELTRLASEAGIKSVLSKSDVRPDNLMDSLKFLVKSNS